jgi:hypothetical protein
MVDTLEMDFESHIFISYRRKDSSKWAHLIRHHLSQHYSQNQVFIDVHNLSLGVDFAEAINRKVESCDVLIAVIGRCWLTAPDEGGRRRLDNPEDFVRLEIATALQHGIRVIPVLVNGASKLRPGDLPQNLKLLSGRNAFTIRPKRSRADLEELVGAVKRALEDVPEDWPDEANRHLAAKRHTKALRLIRRAAEAGDVKAMNKLGILYQNEKVELNCPEAFKWVQKAAEAGDVEGMRSLGAMFYHGLGVAPNASNDARAFEWFQKAANREDMQSMYNLGVLYEHGRGVGRDYDQARHWYQKAANAGYPMAPGALWRLDSK